MIKSILSGLKLFFHKSGANAKILQIRFSFQTRTFWHRTVLSSLKTQTLKMFPIKARLKQDGEPTITILL